MKTILHADLDAFYASVEQRDDSKLQGKPVVVGGKRPRGVVAAASYEARSFGIHSAMSMVKAFEQCPELIRKDPDMKRYTNVSKQVFEIFRSFSPLVEGLSLDEAFIDISQTEHLFGPPIQIAKTLKKRVKEEVGLIISVGIGPNKFIAKLASDIDKPDGLLVIQPNEVQSFINPLPIERLYGVGKVSAARLRSLGIETIAALAAYPKGALLKKLGKKLGEQVYNLASGIDDRTVDSDVEAKSFGLEDTFLSDISDQEELKEIIRSQAERVAKRLRKNNLVATTISLKLKTNDFKVKTRQKNIQRPASDNETISQIALSLFNKALRAVDFKPIRLTGVSVSGLEEDNKEMKQLSFENEKETSSALSKTLDAISDRFGNNAIQRGKANTTQALRADRASNNDD